MAPAAPVPLRPRSGSRLTHVRNKLGGESPRLPSDAIAAFRSRVLAWFETDGRKDLPWQIERGPYRVWLSEIMLQQTQVATVVPYFERFTARFPDIAALAAGSDEAVLALWSGLGYYARARNLHRAARAVAERHGGELPRTSAELCALPGIGRSTAGAILSLGCGIPAPILDGNVKRVLCRYWGIDGWPGLASIAATLWSLAEQLSPAERCDEYNQAMMDLGALVCARARPHCDRCPLAAGCRARSEQRTAQWPSPRPRRPLPVRQYAMLILHDEAGRVFLERRPPAGIWGGLWCFPMFDECAAIDSWLAHNGIQALHIEQLPTRRHTLTHFHLDFIPVRMQAGRSSGQVRDTQAGRWTDGRAELGLPAPVRKLLEQFNPYPVGANGT